MAPCLVLLKRSHAPLLTAVIALNLLAAAQVGLETENKSSLHLRLSCVCGKGIGSGSALKESFPKTPSSHPAILIIHLKIMHESGVKEIFIDWGRRAQGELDSEKTRCRARAVKNILSAGAFWTIQWLMQLESLVFNPIKGGTGWSWNICTNPRKTSSPAKFTSA
jgi:hypothetical protein